MKMFFERPVFMPVGDGLNIVLVQDFHFFVEGVAWFIPEGFESDWASVPRCWWNIVPPHQFPQAALVHDFLYSCEGLTRSQCDKAFYMALRELGASWLRSGVMWLAVRVGGWAVWDSHNMARVNALRERVDMEPIILK